MRYAGSIIGEYSKITTNSQQVAPGGTITGSGAPFPPTGYSNYTTQAPEEEPEPVR